MIFKKKKKNPIYFYCSFWKEMFALFCFFSLITFKLGLFLSALETNQRAASRLRTIAFIPFREMPSNWLYLKKKKEKQVNKNGSTILRNDVDNKLQQSSGKVR